MSGDSRIRVGLFDMDGTMYDTERLSTEGWLEAGRVTGYAMDREKIFQFRGRSKSMNEDLFHSWYGKDAPYYALRKIRDEYLFSSVEKYGLPEKKGLRELLTYLRGIGWRLCIVTGTARADASRYWNRTGILDYFDRTLCGDEVKVCKPDPEIYLKAASYMGARPEECCVFEDSPNGIRSAYAAGCHSILIFDQDRGDEESLRMCDTFCESLLEAKEYIQKTFV